MKPVIHLKTTMEELFKNKQYKVAHVVEHTPDYTKRVTFKPAFGPLQTFVFNKMQIMKQEGCIYGFKSLKGWRPITMASVTDITDGQTKIAVLER